MKKKEKINKITEGQAINSKYFLNQIFALVCLYVCWFCHNPRTDLIIQIWYRLGS